jgi:hypothetical protein
MYHNRRDIGGENKSGVIGPVEEEEELMFRMILYYSFQGLISKPTYTFQLPFEQ